MFRNGYLPLGRWWRIPVRMHWTTPLLCLFFTRFEFRPAAWLALILLIVVHELGHAFLVRRYGYRVLGIELGAVGGLCRYESDGSPVKRSRIAWGGVLAQGLLLILALIASRSATVMSDPYSFQVRGVWIETNAFLIGLNLLPIPPLDGAQAWKLLPVFFRRFRARAEQRKKKRRLQDIARLSTDLANGKMSPELEAQLKEVLQDAGQ